MQKKKYSVAGLCLHTLIYTVILTMLVLVFSPFSVTSTYAAKEKTTKERTEKEKTTEKETKKEKTEKEKSIKRVYDYAKVFGKEERQKIEELSEKYYKETGYNYLVFTTTTCLEYEFENTNDRDENDNLYTDACYKAFVEKYGEDDADCVLLMLDLSDNRNAVISGQGELEYLVDDDDCDSIFEDIRGYLSDDDYYFAAMEYLQHIEYYLDEEEEYEDDYETGYDDGSDYSYDSENIYDNLSERDYARIVHAIFAFGITFIIMWIMVARSGGRITVNKSTYMDEYRSKIVAKEDKYIRTKRTKRRISNDNNRSHRSSSGSRRSGSSRRSGGGSHGGGHF